MKWKIKVDGKEHHSAIEDIMAQAVVMRAAKEESWPERDQLPIGDPIGDTDDPMESHRLDALRYMSSMKDRVLVPEGKIFGYTRDQIIVITPKESDTSEFEKYMNPEPKCNCGVFAVHGNVPANGHAHYCDLRKNLSV
jgi:hypothetical protein